MKITKGDAGYIRKQKKKVVIKTILEFSIVIALLVLGITQTGDRLNVLTIVAVLGCLPASKALVEVIMIFPHHSITKEKASEIDEKANLLTRVYDMVFTSEKKIMPVESIVISDSTVCGYSSEAKIDATETAKYIKQYLSNNQFSKVSVKIFKDYTAFVKRAEDMNGIETVESNETKKKEEAMKRVLLNLSL